MESIDETAIGVVVCGERAASCVCAEPPGHYPASAHACGREGCGGVWRGTFESDDFEVVTLPMAEAFLS